MCIRDRPWIQQTAAEKRLEYAKVLGSHNPADLMTKHLNQEVARRHCQCLNLTFRAGRAEVAPQLNNINRWAVWEVDAATEGKPTEEGDWWNDVQEVLNELWRRKWRQHNHQGKET